MRRIVALGVFLGGFWIVTFPFMSVWRSTSTALESLPDLEGDDIVDDRNWDAIFSSGFVVATRVHEGTRPEEYREALVAEGFESASLAGRLWWMKACCGEYGFVQAQVEESEAGGSVVTVSLYDNDVQATWPFISGLGLVVLFVATGVYVGGSGERSPELVRAE